jgi:hypothetical protein
LINDENFTHKNDIVEDATTTVFLNSPMPDPSITDSTISDATITTDLTISNPTPGPSAKPQPNTKPGTSEDKKTSKKSQSSSKKTSKKSNSKKTGKPTVKNSAKPSGYGLQLVTISDWITIKVNKGNLGSGKLLSYNISYSRNNSGWSNIGGCSVNSTICYIKNVQYLSKYTIALTITTTTGSTRAFLEVHT